MVWGALIGAAASLAGGALSSQSNSNAASQAADAAANNIAMQREFAQTGVTWRARDVIRAAQETGIHPLSLLGVNPASFSPVSQAFTGNTALGDAVSRAGQDISRAYSAGLDRDLRARALELQEQQLNLATERGALENELLRTHIASNKARLVQSMTPGVPMMKPERQSMFTTPKPAEVNPIPPGANPGRQPGENPDVAVFNTVDGGKVLAPSKYFKEASEDMSWVPFAWFVRNYIAPMMSESNWEAVQREFGTDPLRWYQYHPLSGAWYPRATSYSQPAEIRREVARKAFADKLRSIRINRPY